MNFEGPYDVVQVFSGTQAQQRERLGEKVTDWCGKNPQLEVVGHIVSQSSDEAFHCLSITLFLRWKA